MPILPAEPEIFPNDLWDRDFSEFGNVRWWCLHTKPRQEKATARHLLGQGLSFYLPQIRKDSRTPGGRAIRSILPLFPCYVFMAGDEVQRLDAFRGGTLVSVLDVADQARLDCDLRQVHQLLGSGLPVAMEPTHPVRTRVRIGSGPLAGVVGTVIRRGPRDRFVAMVDFFGSGAAVDLEGWQVERVDAPDA